MIDLKLIISSLDFIKYIEEKSPKLELIDNNLLYRPRIDERLYCKQLIHMIALSDHLAAVQLIYNTYTEVDKKFKKQGHNSKTKLLVDPDTGFNRSIFSDEIELIFVNDGPELTLFKWYD